MSVCRAEVSQEQHGWSRYVQDTRRKMKAGDVCRCISNFSGISAEELTLYKNDIVQVIGSLYMDTIKLDKVSYNLMYTSKCCSGKACF